MVKIGEKHKMHKLHKIDEKEAEKIAKNTTNEDIQSIKLTHTGNILKYLIHTKSYTLSVNALDGKILNQKQRK